MRSYVENLPERNNLDPSEAEQKAYIEQDKAFHQFYMEQTVLYLQQNGVDVSEFRGSGLSSGWSMKEASGFMKNSGSVFILEFRQNLGRFCP